MEEGLVKVKVALPPGDPSGGDAEWLWAQPVSDGAYVIKNIPTFAMGLSYGDAVAVTNKGGVRTYDHVVRRSGHSTYRVYAKTDRNNPDVARVLRTLEEMHCELEAATKRIVGVDVLPEADIYAVYSVLDSAEKEGILEFEEGHCGHPLGKPGTD